MGGLRLRARALLALSAALGAAPTTAPRAAEWNSPGEAALYEQLVRGPDLDAALERVLRESERRSALVLFQAAGVALVSKRLEDAGYLFHVARFRALYDQALFPPTGTGGNSPMVALSALSAQIGAALNPRLMAEPDTFARVLERIAAWEPVANAHYKPGWEFKQRGDDAEAAAKLAEPRKKFMDGMGGLATLLRDPDYFAAFRVVQDYNLTRNAERPSKEAFDAAIATLKRIENEKGIRGITALPGAK